MINNVVVEITDMEIIDIDTEVFLGANEVGEILNVSIQHVYNLIDRGILPAVRLGGTKRIPKSLLLNSLNELLKTHSG